jgi:hypothetical protein
MIFVVLLTLLVLQWVEAGPCAIIVPPIPKCQDSSQRNILFVVDASNTMDIDRWYSQLLTYTEQLYCSLNAGALNKVGMVLFGSKIYTAIPMARYSFTEWFNKVEAIRASRNTTNAGCCSCCTPTAEGFDEAKAEFLRHGDNDNTTKRIAFVITDGVPSNNNVGSGGNPAWQFNYASGGFNPAQYASQIVAQEANKLKAAGIRVFLVGVPDYLGVPPRTDFFDGTGAFLSATSVNGVPFQQARPENTTWTYNFYKGPNPIVSLPIGRNNFQVNTWDISVMLHQTLDAMCENSESPTVAPTRAPTLPIIQQIDVTFLIDRSLSMIWREDFCASVVAQFKPIPGFHPVGSAAGSSSCWELYMRYVYDQVTALLAMQVGSPVRNLGWASDFQQAWGLRVNILGFACENHQHTPLVFSYSEIDNGGPIVSGATFIALLEKLRVEVIPFGGTCPGLAIEEAVKYVERSPQALFPYQTTILLTDGVFYDMPYPLHAVKGLEAYQVLRFSIGISVAKAGNNYGLTPQEINTQHDQLLGFVGGDKSKFKDMKDGWALLSQVATEIASQIVFPLAQPIPRYTWCGWRRAFNCNSDNKRHGHCKWNGGRNKKSQYKCARI